MELIFATGNANKAAEAQAIVKKHKILSLKDINCFEDIPETHDTIYENALEKADYIWKKYGKSCFSDDTGLEVEALDMAPGVYSARYAGPEKDSEKNMDKLLAELQGVENRRARFHTEVVLVLEGKVFSFQGFVYGVITKEKRGSNGFGYDPVFLPDGFDRTLAELSSEEKNKISHRGMALEKMGRFLWNY